MYTPSFMISHDDFTKEWIEIPEGEGAQFLVILLTSIQPSVTERKDGTLFALMRNTGVAQFPYAFQATSTDFGRTWSANEQGPVPNDGNGIEMTRLASGNVVVAFSNTFSGRYPLVLALSQDEGQSWSVVTDVDGPCEDPECSHGYTSIAQDPTDQSVWVTFTDERRTIGWVHFNEPWLLGQAGEFASPM